jgi:hypothetical protein
MSVRFNLISALYVLRLLIPIVHSSCKVVPHNAISSYMQYKLYVYLYAVSLRLYALLITETFNKAFDDSEKLLIDLTFWPLKLLTCGQELACR